MLIEIFGNNSSLLVVLLIGLSIYFGIQAKKKKGCLVIWTIKNESNQEVLLQENSISILTCSSRFL